jgi:hypothetical protein
LKYSENVTGSLTRDLTGDVHSKSQHVAGKYNNDANDAAEMGGVHHMSKVAALRMWWSGENNPHLNAASNSEEQRLLASLPYILVLVGAGVLIMVDALPALSLLLLAHLVLYPSSPAYLPGPVYSYPFNSSKHARQFARARTHSHTHAHTHTRARILALLSV